MITADFTDRSALSELLKSETGPSRELLDGVLSTKPNTNSNLNLIREM